MADGFSDLPPEQAAPAAAPATPDAQPPAPPNTDIFRLQVPFDSPRLGRVTEIPVRRPTAADILYVGNPVILNPMVDPPSITHDPRLMAPMIFRLTKLSPPELEKMDPRDLVGLFWFISPFLIPAM